MTHIQEIKNKIYSIERTKKITKTMELVSASKLKKAKKNIEKIFPYSQVICKIMENLQCSELEYKHDYFNQRKIKTVGYIIISSERGLCGTLNTNLFKKILLDIDRFKKKKIKNILSIIGSKGISFFHSLNFKIPFQIHDLTENIQLNDLLGIIKIMLDLYRENKIDVLCIAYNKFVNNIKYIPTIFNILPLDHKKNYHATLKWAYLYEPDSQELLDVLLPRYVEFQIYQKVLENITSEHSARMFAMKTANDNAENLIKNLKIFYNKTRQNNITQEINEIISGFLLI